MAAVVFNVPDDVKDDFDKVFDGRNKSAVITELMRKAIIEEQRHADRERIFRALTARRAQRPALSSKALRAARKIGRLDKPRI